MKSFDQLQKETRAVQFNFLLADLATGNTFLDVADTTHNSETRVRNVHNAQVAYDTVDRLGKRLSMTAEQGLEFQGKLQALSKRLSTAERSPT